MKTRFTFLLLSITTFILSAQAPQKMGYQMVVRDTDGNLVASTGIAIRFSIMKDSIDGTLVYREIQTPTTNDLGLLTTQIGIGVSDSGSMDTIKWGKAAHFMQVETDTDGGSNYLISGTSELLSVPYALYAAHADSITMTGTEGNLVTHDGNNWVAKKLNLITSDTGGNVAFDNMQPYLTVNFCICASGIYPSRNDANPFLGEIAIFGFDFAPHSWFKCDGQILPINSNQALFSLMGTTFGGDGRTSFALPDLRGRAPVSTGTGTGLSNRGWGDKFGSETTTLNINNLPNHNHTVQVSFN